MHQLQSEFTIFLDASSACNWSAKQKYYLEIGITESDKTINVQ